MHNISCLMRRSGDGRDVIAALLRLIWGVAGMQVTIIGTGYVGLVSGACIADFGHQVTCVDKDSTKISTLNAGEIPIYEPGLKDIVQSNLEEGRLGFTTALGESVRGADAV